MKFSFLERAVLDFSSKGFTNKELARIFCLSEKNIKQIFDKNNFYVSS